MERIFTPMIVLLWSLGSLAIAPEKLDLSRSKKHILRPVGANQEQSSETYFEEIARDSESARSLANAHRGSFSDARLDALTNRIQDDQRVLLNTLKDSAQTKNFSVPSAMPANKLPADDYLQRQIFLHEEILSSIKASSSPVLDNMLARVQTTLENARDIQKDRRQAQEEKAAEEQRWP